MQAIKEQVIYIAGPITGVDGYKKKFDEVEFEFEPVFTAKKVG